MIELPAIKLAVLVSGSGTTLENIVAKIADKSLSATIEVVVASRPKIRAIERATKAGLPCEVVDRSKYFSVEEFSRDVFRICRSRRAAVGLPGGMVVVPGDTPGF